MIYNGVCYGACPSGYEPITENYCAQQCPTGFQSNDTACVQPVLARGAVPPIQCPPGATRVYNQCLLACPEGTLSKFEICEPVCPPGFTESLDKTSCLAEIFPRISTVRDACYQGETRVGAMCLRPCPYGTDVYPGDNTLCYRLLPPNVTNYFATYGATSAKILFQRTVAPSVCPDGFVAQDNTCYAPCPPNSTGNHAFCYVNCPTGFKQDGFTCIRPTVQRPVARSAVDVVGSYIKYGVVGIAVIFIAVAGFFLLTFVRRAFKG